MPKLKRQLYFQNGSEKALPAVRKTLVPCKKHVKKFPVPLVQYVTGNWDVCAKKVTRIKGAKRKPHRKETKIAALVGKSQEGTNHCL